MSKFTHIAAALILGLASFAGAAQAQSAKKVLIELYTSQGCSSCPPAEAFLGELAKRDDIIALEFHVDYWNYLGWKDPFSSKQYTERQHAYVKRMGKRYVYTPQMVLNGTEDAVGSRRGQVLAAIDTARKHSQIDIVIAKNDAKNVTVKIGGGFRLSSPAEVWLFAYDSRHETSVPRGENSGRTLINTNVVRAIRNVGKWRGKDTEIKLPIGMMGIDDQDGCAIVVQEPDGGRVFGATAFTLAGK